MIDKPEWQFDKNHNVYGEVETTRLANLLLRTQQVGHVGMQQIGVLGIEHRPLGSGFNGAANADIGQNISVIKQGWLTSAVRGEIDGLNVAVRQGGPASAGGATNSDCAGILVDVGIKAGVGFAAALEASTVVTDPAGGTLRQVQTQVGVMDGATDTYVGFAAIAGTGVIDDGLRLLSSGAGSFTNFLRFFDTSGVSCFQVDSAGRITLRARSGATPSKTIRALNGGLSILNDKQTVEILALGDTGNLSVAGDVAGAQLVAAGAAGAGAPGTIRYGATTSHSVGAAGGAAPQPATPLGYIIAYVGGTGVKIPYHNF